MVKRPVKTPLYKTRGALLIAGAIILLAAIAITVYARHKTVTLIPSKNPSNTSNSTAPGSQNSNQNGSEKSAPSTGFNSPANSGSTGSSGTLIAPSGTLVSNHRPSLTSPELKSEQSVCNTTPGASCYIEFTKGSEVKKLPAQATDGSGSTYWTWDVGQAGLSEGTWQITAVASLNGQTKSFTDSLTLDVQP